MEVELDADNILGEGIHWCDRTQALFWTDIQRATLFRQQPGSRALQQ